MASSTAFSCIKSSSRRDDVLLRFEAPAATVREGCMRAGLDSGWSGRDARDALAGERIVVIAVTVWPGRALPRDGEIAVDDFCALSNFGIGIFTGSFSSVEHQMRYKTEPIPTRNLC